MNEKTIVEKGRESLLNQKGSFSDKYSFEKLASVGGNPLPAQENLGLPLEINQKKVMKVYFVYRSEGISDLKVEVGEAIKNPDSTVSIYIDQPFPQSLEFLITY